MENEGIYRAEVSIGSCKATSQPFENKKNSIIKAELNVVSPYFSEYITYTRPESLELCQGTSYSLEIRIAKKKNLFSDLNWYRNDIKLDNRNNTEELFNTEGEYTIFGKFGQCAVVSNDIKVTYKDTIHIKLRNSGMEYVDLSNRADIYFSTSKINAGELVKTTFGYSWYKDGLVYHDQMERSYNSGDGYIYSYIQPSQEGLYYAIGEIGMGNGANCIVSSDSILLHSLDLIDSSKFAFVSDTIEYRFCDNSSFVLHTNNSRALVYEWFKDGNKLDIKSDSLQVRTTGFYEAHVTIKNGGVYNYPFVVEMNFTPNIVFNSSLSSTQQLASNVLDNCNKDENIVLIENYTSFSEVSYQWFFNGDEINFKDYPNLIVREAGAYQVKLLENNCEVLSNILNLESDEKEEINFGNELQYLCNEETLSIKPENDSTSTFLWLMDGELLSTIATNNIKVQEEATYIPIAKNRFCLVEYKPLIVSQLYLPNELGIVGDTIFCPGEKVELSAISQSGLEYRFTKDGETLISSLNPQYSVKESGLYQLYYEKGNCSVASTPIYLKNEFETDLFSESDFLCTGESISLNLFNGENLSYKWHRDSAILETISPSISISQAGSYYSIISSDKCIANSDTLVIKESNPSVAIISGTSSIHYGDSTFINLEILGDAIPWHITLSDGTKLNIDQSPYQYSVSPKQTTTYTITSLTDECGEGIFEGSATIELIILGTKVNNLESINVYPNPSEAYLFVDYKTEGNPIPTMTFLEGKSIPISYEYSDGKMRIDLRALAGGTFLLTLEKDGDRTIKKIIKQ